MKKIAIIMGFLLLLSFGLVKAEGDWKINSYYYGYSGSTVTSTDLDLYFNLTYPEGRPHFYEPNPGWNPGYYTTTEMVFLKTPYLEKNITGKITTSSIVFDLQRNYPSEGEYILVITESNGKLVHLFELELNYNLLVNITNLNWLYGNKLSYTSSNPIDTNKIDSVCGISINLIIENKGDFPYFLGYNSIGDINLEHTLELLKDSSNEPIYSWDLSKINRQDIDFLDLDPLSEMYISLGEKISCNLKIFFDEYSFKLSDHGSGDYKISGDILTNYENNTYGINCDASLSIKPKGIPGFELIILLFSTAIISILKRKRRA